MNQPWLGGGLAQGDVRAVDPKRQSELDSTYVLAQQIGPILGEGTKGNPRQVKRFLNALMIRQAIAKARGFGDSINQAVLAKLMLAERFQSDFYEHIAAQAMVAEGGKVSQVATLEAAARGEAKTAKKEKTASAAVEADPVVEKWLEREWAQRWGKIEPALGGIDLRPYVFVARDKRMLAAAAGLGGLEGLIEKLCGSDMAVRSVEPEVKALPATDAEQVFNALKEQVLRHGSFSSQPPGFHGLGIVAKHHPRFQTELLGIIAGIDVKSLGIWVVRGWNEILTDGTAKTQFHELLNQWAAQDGNPLLKKAAAGALGSVRKAAG